ncbi:MAG: heme o synthase [Proteobacteria bacterium]|nr:heme o synthase [Pseudomonadota bacterium]MDA1308750.1 heme o synthase [Pseudomonadota bacterium]
MAVSELQQTGKAATMARELYGLFKVRIGLAIALTAVAGAAVAGPLPPPWQVLVLALSVLAASSSAGAFNHYAERDLDARMHRTRTRPFASGRYAASLWWPVGIAVLLAVAVGGAALALNALAAFYVFLGAFVYGVVYTVWLKRRTVLNIVIGGLAGSFSVLAGAAVTGGAHEPAALMLALVMFLWTPPHFWSLATALKEDYAQAGVPMLPVVAGSPTTAWISLAHVLALVLLSLLPLGFGMGWVYGAAAVGGGLIFLRTSIAFVRAPTKARAMQNFHGSLIQLSLLLLGAICDRLVG